jgi:hypothetical protein
VRCVVISKYTSAADPSARCKLQNNSYFSILPLSPHPLLLNLSLLLLSIIAPLNKLRSALKRTVRFPNSPSAPPDARSKSPLGSPPSSTILLDPAIWTDQITNRPLLPRQLLSPSPPNLVLSAGHHSSPNRRAPSQLTTKDKIPLSLRALSSSASFVTILSEGSSVLVLLNKTAATPPRTPSKSPSEATVS